ncbi:M48 family metallopeptidase [Nocardioides sp. zg-536]|uniref:M48 family metallopeptidase n=1 Tax=Nocardioides faecalis TaxID=2803858 RepID=A0A939BU70_9ACTN|nr:M48 family metallopeptidase [Nocardioides faecalis]MBM9461364.1 M48 family metallopeptidase [Nocardioides faecalis]QVI57633.1 M48 family metallopeptidase [Nocardioides faecalis]
MSRRSVAALTVVVGALAFVVIAVWRVPWEPVPGGTPPPVPADSVFTEAQIARAEHLAAWSRVWSWSSLALSLAVACWLGFGRLGRRWAGRVRGWRWVRVVVVVAALSLVGRVVTLPFAIALRRLRLDEGLAAGTWGAWARDLVVSELVTVASTSLAVLALLACVRLLPRLWPLIAGLGAAAVVVLGSFVYPVLVEPLFNDFTSLPDGELRTEILQLADREGVDVEDVLVADASRRTTTLNAYVSGIGSTRRVVLYDTLVESTPPAEALSVVAHELAHAKHDDVVTGTLLGAAGAMVALGLLGLVLPAGGRGAPEAAPVEPGIGVRDIPRLLALAALVSLLASPVQNGISRQMETRADQVALESTGDPQAFRDLQVRLALRSLADPTPPAWSQWWFGSHPTVLQRVAHADAFRG